MSNFSKSNIYNEETYKWINKNKSLDDSTGIVKIVLPEGKKPTNNGKIMFLRANWLLNVPFGVGPGVFSVYNRDGIAIMGLKRKDSDDASREVQYSITLILDEKAGEYGKAMQIMSNAIETASLSLIAECKEKKQPTVAEGMVRLKKVNGGVVKTHYAESNLKTPNELMKNPLINFRIEFGTFMNDYSGGVSGASKIEVFDARKRIENKREDSFAGYERATISIKNEANETVDVPIDENNIEQFVTQGSRAILFKYMANSPSANAQGLTYPLKMWKMVILPGVAKIACDEDDTDIEPDMSNMKIENPTVSNATPKSALDDFGDEF